MIRNVLFLLRPTALFVLMLLVSCANRQESSPLAPLFLLQGGESSSILIIGDSLTLYSGGFHLQEMPGTPFQVKYIAEAGYDFPDWTIRLDAALTDGGNDPNGILLIPLGTNDAMHFSPDQFIQNVFLFHNQLRLRTQEKVYYFLMPRTENASLSQAILQDNATLKASLPADHTGLIDLDSAFQNAPSSTPLYTSVDPIHPTDAGYTIIGQTIAGALNP